ncbi:hypothetical protein Tco_0032823 [Tanacetum coccineum]
MHNSQQSQSAKSSRSKSIENTKNDKIPQISSSTQKKNKVEDHSRIVNSMFDARHELLFLEFVFDMNASSNSKSFKKAKKKEEWKPIRKMITATNKVSLKEPIPLEVVTQEYRRPKVPKTSGSNSKPKIAKSMISNKMEPGTSGGSNTLVAPSSSSLVDLREYHNSRVYYVEGICHNLFSVSQFCDSDLEVAFRKHTCFVHNLEGVDSLLGSRETNLYTLSIRDMMASSPICLLRNENEADKSFQIPTTEYIMVVAANYYGHVLWIQNQMHDYGFNFMNTKIFTDNESTICIVKNLVFHSKTKHIKIRHHFIKDCYEKKLIQVIKIQTDHNVADLLTKAFDVSKFNFLIASI